MKTKDILKLENGVMRNRKYAFLIREGEWWRAYEWSAYLIYNLIQSEPDKLKPIRKSCDLTEDGLIMVGFKNSSVEKYLDGLKIYLDYDEEVSTIPSCSSREYTEQQACKILSQWKSKYEIRNPHEQKNELKNAKSYSIDEIIKEILNFNVERSTLIEDVAFLSEIKLKLNNICSQTARRTQCEK